MAYVGWFGGIYRVWCTYSRSNNVLANSISRRQCAGRKNGVVPTVDSFAGVCC